MVDPGIEARVERMRTALKKLEGIRQMGSERFLVEPLAEDAAERNLHVVIEALIDIGNYIIARQGFETPETYADIPRILGRKRIMPQALEESFVSMVGLRNLLVHDYASIEPTRILRMVTEELDLLKEIAKVLIQVAERA
jgi:uncharacterized protein YutE (UPF0331/DUF86 family)